MKFEDYERKRDTSRASQKGEALPVSEASVIKKTENPAWKPYAEPVSETLNLTMLQNNLGNCLKMIDDEVMKGYVRKLDQLPVVRPDARMGEALSDIHFFRISELVYQEDEFSVDKLAMIFHALSNSPCTVVMMLRSDGEKTDFYLGVRPNSEKSAGTMFQMLKRSLLGFFPGSKISEYYDEDMKRDMEALAVGSVSAVTCVADYKQEMNTADNKDFIQGLEKFVYSMRGNTYTAVLIADNISSAELMQRKREYEQIYTQMSPFANMQMNFTVSDGTSSSTGSSDGVTVSKTTTVSKGTSESKTSTDTHTTGTADTIGTTETDTHTVSDTESDGKTHTTGITEGTSYTVTEGTSASVTVSESLSVSKGGSVGASVGAPVGGAVSVSSFSSVSVGLSASESVSKSHSESVGHSRSESVSDSISKTLTHGFSDSTSTGRSNSHGINESDSVSESVGTSETQSEADAIGASLNLVNTKALTETFGTSRGVTLSTQNMTLNLMLQRIAKHLERIEECESFGMWNFAAYFLGESAAETDTAARVYKSVIAGADSGIETSAVHSWLDGYVVKDLCGYIKNFVHPKFVYQGFSYDEPRNVLVDPSALVSSNELAIHMGLPRHSVRGLPVVEHAQFAQEIVANKTGSDRILNLGKIYNLGQKTETDVNLDTNSLSMHTFITGSTGSGKSNAVYHLLSEAKRNGIPFLVVEPAKGEYKDVFTDVRCFGTNPLRGEILKINPFSFPSETHVLEHIDRIVEIFNVCWPMYAAMPAVLKESIEQAYLSAGWDLDLSENTKVPELYPTFDDVLRELNNTIHKSEYSTDTKGDYIGSLSTRIKSLTNGINGRIFVSDETPLEDLFDKSAIIDISRVGAAETKALIMGLTVLKLQEYRMAKAEEMNVPLKHLTVLEEAHNLLKKTSTEQSQESSNVMGKSVEMLTNAIAEIRTYGEGFIIVDQAPNLLDTAAIRNTNTKIVMRLPESMDREVTGGAIALKEQQFAELPKLPTGVAAVYQNDWQEAVLCVLPKYEAYDLEMRKEKHIPAVKAAKDKSRKLLHLLLKRKMTEGERQAAVEQIKYANIPAKTRKDLIWNIGKKNMAYEWAVADFINKNFDFSNVFRGTSEPCGNLKDLYYTIRQNIAEEFVDFDEQELYAIVYYICRIEHEKYPQNKVIEKLRTDYLREKVIS